MTQNQDQKLFYIAGTVCARTSSWVTILDTSRILHWIESNRNLTSAKEGEVVWLLYSYGADPTKGNTTRRAESVIPYEQCTAEDLDQDFNNEAAIANNTPSNGNSSGSGQAAHPNRNTPKQVSGK